MRGIAVGLAAFVLLFGLACLNYTKAGDWERHREAAARRGFPPPSRAIFYGGVLATVLGSAGLGFAAGASGRARRPGAAGDP